MKKQYSTVLLLALLALTVACNKKEDDDDVVAAPIVLVDLNDLVGGGDSACMTTNLDKIGTAATNTPHSYKYSVDIDNTGELRFYTYVYRGAVCDSSTPAFYVDQFGDLAVVNGSTATGGTNVTFTQSSMTFNPQFEAWRLEINGACPFGFNIVDLSHFGIMGGRTCVNSPSFLSISYPFDTTVLKNTLIFTDVGGVKKLKFNHDVSNHLDFFSFGKATNPTTATFEITYTR